MAFENIFVKITIFIAITGSLFTPMQTQECCEEYCYESDPEFPRAQYRNLGQRNSYDLIKGYDYQIYDMPGKEL